MQLERIARMYVPLSSYGLRFDGEYTEIAPCPALAPYLRCFWGSLHARRSCGGSRVIPDSCMDLIFEVNYTNNRVTGHFCGLDDAPCVTPDHSSDELLAQLIRHQLIYREVLEGRYRALDAVEKYGYADQSHLLRDFRRFQGVLPGELPWKNDKNCRISSIHEE